MTRHHLSKCFGHELIVVVVLQGAGVDAHLTNFVIVELQTNVQLLLLGQTAPSCLKIGLKSSKNHRKIFEKTSKNHRNSGVSKDVFKKLTFLWGTFVDRS